MLRVCDSGISHGPHSGIGRSPEELTFGWLNGFNAELSQPEEASGGDEIPDDVDPSDVGLTY